MQVIPTDMIEGNTPEKPSGMVFKSINLQIVPENAYERVFLYEVRDNPQKLTFSLPIMFSKNAQWSYRKGKK